jgi:hypothetical protein
MSHSCQDQGIERRRQDLHDYLAEMLDGVGRNANVGASFIDMGDEVGAEYCARRTAAYLRAAIATLVDLRKMRPAEEEDHGR